MNRAQRRRQACNGIPTSRAIAVGTGVPQHEVDNALAKLADLGFLRAETDGTYSPVQNVSQVRDRLLAWPDPEAKALLEWLKEDGRHRWPQLRTAADFQEHYDEVLADYQQRNQGQAP